MKENTANFYGIANDVKTFATRDDPDTIAQARIVMTAVCRTYSTNQYVKSGPAYSTKLILYSKDPTVCKYMAKVRKGDAIQVKGTPVSKDVEKKYRCAACGQVFIDKKATTVYIDPVFVSVRERYNAGKLEKKDIIELIMDEIEDNKETLMSLIAEKYVGDTHVGNEQRNELHAFAERIYEDVSLRSKGLSQTEMRRMIRLQGEIGNEFIGIGTLVRDPVPEDLYINPRTNKAQFKALLAFNRIRHIYTDDPDKRTDYIMFVSNSKYAPLYYEVLKKGSSIYIRGNVTTREFERKIECTECGYVNKAKALATEIRALNVVFLKNCQLVMSDVGKPDYDDIFENVPDDQMPQFIDKIKMLGTQDNPVSFINVLGDMEPEEMAQTLANLRLVDNNVEHRTIVNALSNITPEDLPDIVDKLKRIVAGENYINFDEDAEDEEYEDEDEDEDDDEYEDDEYDDEGYDDDEEYEDD